MKAGGFTKCLIGILVVIIANIPFLMYKRQNIQLVLSLSKATALSQSSSKIIKSISNEPTISSSSLQPTVSMENTSFISSSSNATALSQPSLKIVKSIPNEPKIMSSTPRPTVSMENTSLVSSLSNAAALSQSPLKIVKSIPNELKITSSTTQPTFSIRPSSKKNLLPSTTMATGKSILSSTTIEPLTFKQMTPIRQLVKFHDKPKRHHSGKNKRIVVVFTTLFGKKVTDTNELKRIAQINTLQALANLKPKGLYSIAFVDDPYWTKKAIDMGINRVRPILSKNKYGTPFLHQMLKVARKVKAPFHCYINGDILLGLTFIETLQMVLNKIKEKIISKRVYIIGRRYNYNLKASDILPANLEDGEMKMNQFALQSDLGQPDAFDYFVFSNNAFKWAQIPRFVIGRRAYDNCLTHIAVQDKGVVTIDTTMTIRAIHQTDSFGNRANKHFKHKDDLWNEIQCWQQRYLGWVYFCEFETQWDGIAPVITKYGNVYSKPIPLPAPKNSRILLIKRELNQHEKMVLTLEEQAIEKNIAMVTPLRDASILYTSSTASIDPYLKRLATKVKIIYLIDVNEKCSYKIMSLSIRNMKYTCIPTKPKTPPPMIWDNKEDAPPNTQSPWKKYSDLYETALMAFGGNSTKYDIAILVCYNKDM
jgi:hypothetical protein